MCNIIIVYFEMDSFYFIPQIMKEPSPSRCCKYIYPILLFPFNGDLNSFLHTCFYVMHIQQSWENYSSTFWQKGCKSQTNPNESILGFPGVYPCVEHIYVMLMCVEPIIWASIAMWLVPHWVCVKPVSCSVQFLMEQVILSPSELLESQQLEQIVH